uniref:hypothetical protein n=1 Tax=Marinobacterium profundum TaxID=1714300 RepID=UPI000ABD2618|nr:hypothetical protein [Marinobacterium profundum]
MTIDITPEKILRLFVFVISFLLMANVMGIISRIYFEHDHVYGLVSLFDFNAEKNIPTLYSSIALVFASILLLFISIIHRNKHEPYFLWGVLSFIFLFLSIDEISSIHENLGTPTRDFFGASGLLYYAWVIPYGVFLVVFLISYFKFLLVLPKKL